jgi:hypothetical protein
MRIALLMLLSRRLYRKSVFAILSALFLALIPLAMVPQVAQAAPTITVISPQSGSSSGSQVFFEASARSSCPNGISAMRIYTAPYVSAYTVYGAHLETFINLAPGSYGTVVQAWDKCGGVAKTPVTITVVSTPQVSIFLPNTASAFSPIHFAASAQNPSCPAGIAAMRIYTSWGFTPYTVDSDELDAYVVLQATSYHATIEAWDNCGNVFTSNVAVTSSGGDSDAYAYTASHSGVISEFKVSSNGSLVNPNGSGTPPQFQSAAGANTIATDPGGWFTYTAAQTGVFGYQINPASGALAPTPNSPLALPNPSLVFADPAGNFLYAIYGGSQSIASLHINRSSGDLTVGSTLTPGVTFTALTTDPYGEFLYATTNSSKVYGYKVNGVTGALTPVPGSPFQIAFGNSGFAISSAYTYLYVDELTGSNNIPEIIGYQISYNSGYLSPVPGVSAYSVPGSAINSQALLTDWLTRYQWTGGQDSDFGQNNFFEWHVDGYTGVTSSPSYIGTGNLNVDYLTEGHAANLVYTAAGPCGSFACVPNTVNSWSIDGSGLLDHLSGPLNTGTENLKGIAVSRKNPQ